MTVHARRGLVSLAAAVAASAVLWAAMPGARAQENEPPADDDPAAVDLCRPSSDRDPMPEVVVRKVALYYGRVSVGSKVIAEGVDTTSPFPQALSDAVGALDLDPLLASGLDRRTSTSLDPVAWLQSTAPDENAPKNLVRYWEMLAGTGVQIVVGEPQLRGTLYFKVAEWEESDGGIVPTLTRACGVAAVSFFIVNAEGVPPADGDYDPDLFPPTPTPTATRPPLAVFDPPPPVSQPVSRPTATPVPTRTATLAPTPARTIPAPPGLTPTPRASDDDVAGVITNVPTQPLPTPRPPAAGAGPSGAGQQGGVTPLLLAGVLLLSGSASLLALSRRRRP